MMSGAILLPAAGACLAGVLVYGFFVEPRRLRLERTQVELKGLPPELDGLRLAHLTDFHIGRSGFRETMALRAVALANALDPDLVVLTGDLVTRQHSAPRLLPILAKLRAKHGVWVALGNHDYNVTRATAWTAERRRAFGPEMWREMLGGVGVRLLENESQELHVEGSSLWLAGCGDPYSERDDLPATLAEVPEGAPCVLLCHSPDIADHYAAQRVGLVLCGHTHGGQIRLPILGPIWAPCRDYRGRATGFTRVGDTWLYASRGVCAGNFFRLRCPPEVALVTLRAEGRRR